MSSFLSGMNVLTGGVNVMSAGLRLCLGLGLSRHGGVEGIHYTGLVGARCGLRSVSRGP